MQQLRVFLSLVLSLFCTVLPACSNVEPAGISVSPPPAVRSTETVNINTANTEELGRIPHIGAALAEAVIKHRETHGPFRRPEDLMLVNGISDTRFRRIRHLIKTE